MPYDAEVTIKEQLERAKDAIRERGHAKSQFVGFKGEVCTSAAIDLGVGRPVYYGSAPTAAHRAVAKQIDPLDADASRAICRWNNRVETTPDDVIALFDRTIASL